MPHKTDQEVNIKLEQIKALQNKIINHELGSFRNYLAWFCWLTKRLLQRNCGFYGNSVGFREKVSFAGEINSYTLNVNRD